MSFRKTVQNELHAILAAGLVDLEKAAHFTEDEVKAMAEYVWGKLHPVDVSPTTVEPVPTEPPPAA